MLLDSHYTLYRFWLACGAICNSGHLLSLFRPLDQVAGAVGQARITESSPEQMLTTLLVLNLQNCNATPARIYPTSAMSPNITMLVPE